MQQGSSQHANVVSMLMHACSLQAALHERLYAQPADLSCRLNFPAGANVYQNPGVVVEGLTQMAAAAMFADRCSCYINMLQIWPVLGSRHHKSQLMMFLLVSLCVMLKAQKKNTQLSNLLTPLPVVQARLQYVLEDIDPVDLAHIAWAAARKDSYPAPGMLDSLLATLPPQIASAEPAVCTLPRLLSCSQGLYFAINTASSVNMVLWQGMRSHCIILSNLMFKAH